jgi:pimeloyl-ACP methyl ester carboxylesterase
VDWAEITPRLEPKLRTIAPDLIGFGWSDKPHGGYSIAAQADAVEDVAAALGVREAAIVAHDYGTIVVQELLDRARAGRERLTLSRVALLNGGIVYAAYRPTRAHKLLTTPVLGALFAASLDAARWRRGIDGVLGNGRRLSDAEWDGLWTGMSRNRGHRLAHKLMHYIPERSRHATRWEAALAAYPGPLALIWGLADPVSGEAVLRAAEKAYPSARVTALPGVGHWPQLEAPEAVAAPLLEFLV